MQRVDRDVLSRVCAALGCSVGDVMVYVSDERKKGDEEDIEALVSVT
jgi:DNA-binding Xre family transcriptional regulator